MFTIEQIVDLIRLEQLEILGFPKEYVFIVFILLALFCAFICCRLIVALFGIKKNPIGFTFILSSLFVLSAFAIYITAHGEFIMLRNVFQATFLFEIGRAHV